jgi:hypothetical protein
MNGQAQAAFVAFNVMCNYIRIRDLFQEHLTCNVWPLRAKWEMLEPKGGSPLMRDVEKGSCKFEIHV